MSRVTNLVRGAAALAIVAGGWACSSDVKILGTKPTHDLFQSYVALGNSITAGYQSGGINDSTQRRSYAYLLAQAMRTRFAYPSLRMPGCTPPQANFLTGALVNTPGTTTPATPGSCALRNPSSVTDVLNNVAVPGAAAIDPVTQGPTPNSNTVTNLFLGGKSQVRKALEADPTFATVWIGNNDVLAAATRGVTVAEPTTLKVPGITSQADFERYYRAMMDTLTGEADRLEGGVLIGVVNVTLAPVLWPAAALHNPLFIGGISQAVGSPVVVHPSCGTAVAPSASLISTGIITFLRSLPAAQRIIACEKGVLPAPLGDWFVLDSQEQAQFAAAVNGYNAFIQAQAAAHGFAYWDPNPLLLAQKQQGCISTVPNLASATAPYGTCMSLDGAHPGNTAHVLIANALKDVINAKYGTNIPLIQ